MLQNERIINSKKKVDLSTHVDPSHQQLERQQFQVAARIIKVERVLLMM